MKQLLAPVFLVVIAGAVFFLYIQPTYSSIQSLRAENARVTQALDKAHELDDQRADLRTRFNNLDKDDKERLLRLLPDNIDNVRLIIDIDNIAAQYGLQIRDFGISEQGSPGGQASADGGGSAGNAAQQQSNQPSVAYRSVDLEFSITATYEDFLVFLSDLERSLRLVDVSYTSVASGGDAYTYGVNIKTYWLP